MKTFDFWDSRTLVLVSVSWSKNGGFEMVYHSSHVAPVPCGHDLSSDDVYQYLSDREMLGGTICRGCLWCRHPGCAVIP